MSSSPSRSTPELVEPQQAEAAPTTTSGCAIAACGLARAANWALFVVAASRLDPKWRLHSRLSLSTWQPHLARSLACTRAASKPVSQSGRRREARSSLFHLVISHSSLAATRARPRSQSVLSFVATVLGALPSLALPPLLMSTASLMMIKLINIRHIH